MIETTAGTTAEVVNRMVYSYDAANRLIDSLDAATSVGAIKDPAALSVGGDDPRNIRTRYLYDADSLVVGVYDPRAFTSSVTSPNNRYLTRIEFDRAGRPVTEWHPYWDNTNPETTLLWNGEETTECPTTTTHQPASVAGVPAYPSGVGLCATSVEYDKVGNLTKVGNATQTVAANANRYTGYTYTDDNLVRTVSEANPTGSGRVTSARYEYDASGRPVSVTDAADWVVESTWTADGLVAEEIGAPAGGSTEQHRAFEYNAHGQPISITTDVDPIAQPGVSETQTSSYYADGQTYEELTAAPASLATRYGYDRNGNTTQIWSPSAVNPGTSGDDFNDGVPVVHDYTYDNLLAASLEPIASDGALRRRTSFGYDALGRKTLEQVGEVTGAPAFTTVGSTLNDRTWEWSDNGWILANTGRDGTDIEHTWTVSGQPASITDAASGSTVGYTYFLNGWTRSVTSSGAGRTPSTTGYRYYGDGLELARVEAPSSSINSSNNWEAWQAYTYNDGRALVSGLQWGWGQDWKSWSYTYDQAGRPDYGTDIAGHRVDWTHNADGTLDQVTVFDGNADQPGRADELDTWSYEYDGYNRIRTRTREVEGNTTLYEQFGYDSASRINSYATGPNSGAMTTRPVTWDRNGNRTSYDGTSWTYRADNSIATNNGTAFSYDAGGRLTNDECWSYAYDGYDRLETATGQASTGCAGDSETTTYDALGRPIEIVTTGTDADTRNLRYIGSTNLLSHDIGSNANAASTSSRYITGPDGVGAAVSTATTPVLHSVHDDGQGNVVLATPSGASAACRTGFDPWGNTTSGQPDPCPANATHNGLWYQSGRLSTTTSEYQFGARTYNPSNASWLSPDTLSASTASGQLSIGTDPLTANRYSYVNGDPINFSDPSGHWRIPNISKYLDKDFLEQARAEAELKEQQAKASDEIKEYLDDHGALPAGWDEATYEKRLEFYMHAVLINGSDVDVGSYEAWQDVPQEEQFALWEDHADAALNRIKDRDCDGARVPVICRNKERLLLGATLVLTVSVGVATGGAASVAVGSALGVGTTTGAVSGAGLVTAVVSGGVGGVGSSVANQLATKGEVDLGQVLREGGIGAVSGGLTYGFTAAVGQGVRAVQQIRMPAAPSSSVSATAQARTLGAQGETLAGINPNVVKTRVPSMTGSANYRVPDALTDSVLTEVKNVQRLGFTGQIQDFTYYATQTGRRFDLVVRQNTRITRELQDIVNMTDSPINLIRGLPAR